MIYEILCQYLTEKNYNEDGSPSDDDDYYMIAKIISNRPVQDIRDEIEKDEWVKEYESSKEIMDLFKTDEYIEDSLRLLKLLSDVGHKEK